MTGNPYQKNRIRMVHFRKKEREEMIDRIIEYYTHAWEDGDDSDLYEELQDHVRYGTKGLENESLVYIRKEYKEAMEFLRENKK
jgi:uncharacterized protein YhfF